jgi:putative tricarboxylic transport membrane protein
MKLSADRLSGTFFLLLGLAMLLFVNPVYIETVDGGNLEPSTLPNAISIVIAVCGGLLVLRPTSSQVHERYTMLVAGFYVLLLVAGLYAMSWFGFEYVAPVLALAIMWFIGERRPLWLAFGTIGMPALIWFLVTQALGRALP